MLFLYKIINTYISKHEDVSWFAIGYFLQSYILFESLSIDLYYPTISLTNSELFQLDASFLIISTKTKIWHLSISYSSKAFCSVVFLKSLFDYLLAPTHFHFKLASIANF